MTDINGRTAVIGADTGRPLGGPGLFEITRANGERHVTSIRRLAGQDSPPGARLVAAATILLGLLAAALFVVTLSAQYRYVFAVKQQSVPSMIQAVGLDAGMVVFSLLALGLAVAGQSARIERTLIVVCALASAGQNYAAADVTSPRSVAAYVLPPLFLVLVVDRVVAVARRHVLGDSERSVWATLGRTFGRAGLYALRFAVAAPSTASGVRRLILTSAPLPGPVSAPQSAGLSPAADRGKTDPARALASQSVHVRPAAKPEAVTVSSPAAAAAARAAEAVRLRDSHPEWTWKAIAVRVGTSDRQLRRDLAAHAPQAVTGKADDRD
jgi:hypothetical protein